MATLTKTKKTTTKTSTPKTTAVKTVKAEKVPAKKDAAKDLADLFEDGLLGREKSPEKHAENA